jgi:DNA-binding ferritin-like protein (Dps family)|tara:strand:+ start:2085 stop:2282 length:198 start_codon:yes stop_codon:yes gene_type:complete
MDKELQRIIEIHKERQLAMKELSQSIGIDISFSDEELAQYISEAYAKNLSDKIKEGLDKWMKSAF